MSNWSEIMHAYFGEVIKALQELLALLQPDAIMPAAWILFQAMLPPPIDVSFITNALTLGIGYLAPSFLALDYFIDMTAFVAVIGWIAVIEFGTFFFRMWRTVRSVFG